MAEQTPIEALARVKAETHTRKLRVSTDRAALVMAAWKAIHDRGDAAPVRESVPFWDRASTEVHCRALDVWASVHRARSAGVRDCPKFDAIFERPRLVIAEDEARYIGQDGNPVVSNNAFDEDGRAAMPVGDG